jgi:hypothetical protein
MSTGINTIARRGIAAGLAVVYVLLIGIGIGSQNMLDYDPALVIYTLGTLISAYVITWRVTIFYHRPPTLRYVVRAKSLLFSKAFFPNLILLGKLTVNHFGMQKFILNRARIRWFAHILISWGTIIAFSVTIPLVFGWVHFETPMGEPETYSVYSFGVHMFDFPLGTIRSFLIFNALNFSAVMVIVGVVIALHRRLYAPGRSKARQQFSHDLVPLILLLAVSGTGLMLTYSTHTMKGYGYAELSLIHAMTVTLLLIYLPFGKLFHLFVRPLHLAVELHHAADAKLAPARCKSCDAEYAGAMHVQDLKDVLEQVGMSWQLNEDGDHYADICPQCRRRLLGASQAKLLGTREELSPWHV